MKSIKRNSIQSINAALSMFPVVAIIGPRQVGKTTLAKEICSKHKNSIYLDLELPSDAYKLQEAEIYLSENKDKLIVIDEMQNMPKLFPILRAVIDKDRRNARFLILGSASPNLIKNSSESLAGRIFYHELTPFNLNEIGHLKLNQLWMNGGYPESFLASSSGYSYEWREAFISTYLERDIPQLGIRIPASMLRRFWTMIAHSHGQLWNASQIASSLAISPPTVKHYLDILEGTFIIRQLQPFFQNIKKRLVKSPKIYIRDSGLLHTLLSRHNIDDLKSHPIVGNSWEGFIIEQIISTAPKEFKFYFYRTQAGAEIDLLAIDKNENIIAIEIKYSLNPTLTKGFWNAVEDLKQFKNQKLKKVFVVYPGIDTYPIKENVYLYPAEKIATLLSSLT